MTYEQKITHLRTFFGVSTAAFTFHHSIQEAIGHVPVRTKMEELHLLAKEELSKEEPDLKHMDSLLEQMEMLADQNAKDKLPRYTKGNA